MHCNGLRLLGGLLCPARWLAVVWLALAALLTVPAVAAGTDDPAEIIATVSDEVITALRGDKGLRSGDRQRAIALIENKVAPHFDFDRMTALAVGQSWRKASPEQRKALVTEFRTLLIRTYANALSAYRDQTVTVKKATSTGSNEVRVRSQVNQPGAEALPVDYDLARTAEGWKVFDVSVADVSLVTSYRGSFAEQVNKGGLDGLLKSLQAKNRNLAAATSSK